ncbi:MAG: COX15/CtaA family protein [Acidimicrobiia bacterium]|nr:COX15/CtaA family protein [Acidimicrobiia bacterium]
MPDSPSDTAVSSSRRLLFAATAWATLSFTVLVILGGTVVRATGSGDGCGESWPKCGDQFIPPNPTVETLIEFSHRASSFLAGIGVAIVFFLALWVFPRGHLVRKAATWSGIFLVLEALLGAALVLFGWVDDDVSLGRTIVVPLHLANTFFLLGALTLTAWWGSGRALPRRTLSSASGRWIVVGAILIVVIGATGALNALADTIFPADSVAGDLADKFGPTAPLLSRLRLVHPLVAVVAGMIVAWIASGQARSGSEMTRRAASAVTLIVLSQMFIGIANIYFLTPLSLQVIHLVVADALWIAYVIFAASWLGEPARSRAEATVPV